MAKARQLVAARLYLLSTREAVAAGAGDLAHRARELLAAWADHLAQPAARLLTLPAKVA